MERVARLYESVYRQPQVMDGPWMGTVRNVQEWQRNTNPRINPGDPLSPQEIDSNTFVVYTKAEVDSLQVSAAARVDQADAGLQKLLLGLQKDLKALSDLNDALTKRLDALEKRIGPSK